MSDDSNDIGLRALAGGGEKEREEQVWGFSFPQEGLCMLGTMKGPSSFERGDNLLSYI